MGGTTKPIFNCQEVSLIISRTVDYNCQIHLLSLNFKVQEIRSPSWWNSAHFCTKTRTGSTSEYGVMTSFDLRGLLPLHGLLYYRPQGKVMFSEAFVCLPSKGSLPLKYILVCKLFWAVLSLVQSKANELKTHNGQHIAHPHGDLPWCPRPSPAPSLPRIRYSSLGTYSQLYYRKTPSPPHQNLLT